MGARKYVEMPGLAGVPYRHYDGEPAPMYRTGDPMSEQPSARKEMHSRIFDLCDDKQRAEYDAILSKVVDSPAQFRLSTENIQWCEKKSTFIAFLRWEERWLERSAKAARPPPGNAGDVVYAGEQP